MQKFIFILEGETGAQDDKCSWIVGSFLSEKSAQKYKKDLEKWFKENTTEDDNGVYIKKHDPYKYMDENCGCPMDTNMANLESTGVVYYVYQVEILDVKDV